LKNKSSGFGMNLFEIEEQRVTICFSTGKLAGQKTTTENRSATETLARNSRVVNNIVTNAKLDFEPWSSNW
jgi:hypothetical protein